MTMKGAVFWVKSSVIRREPDIREVLSSKTDRTPALLTDFRCFP
jgi:hypothetical protein